MSRIIAGSRGGRRILMPPGAGTRPTTDRVREALFSAIASWAGTAAGPAESSLADLAFCDLYAGSGAVGLEAASRGAGPVLLVEADRRTVAVTQRNVTGLGLAATVSSIRVETLLQQAPPQAFDVVFADPPYDLDTGAVDGTLNALLAGGWVAERGLVVVERSRRSAALRRPAAAVDQWVRNYGETAVCFTAL